MRVFLTTQPVNAVVRPRHAPLRANTHAHTHTHTHTHTSFTQRGAHQYLVHTSIYWGCSKTAYPIVANQNPGGRFKDRPQINDTHLQQHHSKPVLYSQGSHTHTHTHTHVHTHLRHHHSKPVLYWHGVTPLQGESKPGLILPPVQPCSNIYTHTNTDTHTHTHTHTNEYPSAPKLKTFSIFLLGC